MSEEVYRSAIEQIAATTKDANLHHFGESLLHPKLGPFIALVSARSIRTYLSVNPGLLEIGPRALGRRAILARADSTAIPERINFLKGREPWRPLAPSLTPRRAVASPSGKGSPHMLQSTAIQESVSDDLAGVMHVDGSTRPQVVEEQDAFTDLRLKARLRVGCEALICTSFDRAGDPIVYTIEDAYARRSRYGSMA